MQAGGAPTFRQLPHILFSKSIIPNGQKIARGISSVGKFRDRKCKFVNDVLQIREGL